VHYSRNANSVICLPPNMIKASKSKLGDILDLNAEVSKSYKEELLKSNPLITASIEGSFVNLKEKN
ncbi:MAG TPA: hypothetical protein QF753_10310, partial [Victivallales bacterium]|nr:hypothetical protein [Victivallales bacterium]